MTTQDTASARTPTFHVRGTYATLRGALILFACMTLGTVFVVQSWSGPSSTAEQAEVRS
jgi:hypothetical protein